MNSIQEMNQAFSGEIYSLFVKSVESEGGLDDAVDVKKSYAKSNYLLGKLYYDKADFTKAEEYFLESLRHFAVPSDVYSILKVFGFLIRISSEKMDDVKAQSYILKAEKIVDNLTMVLGSLTAEYFFNLGVVKNYRSLFDEARENFLLAIRKSKEENDPEITAKCLLALASNSMNVRAFEEALIYLNQLNDLLAVLKKDYLKGSMHFYFGKIYTETDRLSMAKEHFSLAAKTLTAKKCWNLMGYVHLARGVLSKKFGEFDRALWMYQIAKESVEQESFARLNSLVDAEVADVNDASVDIYLDKENRKVVEREKGEIDFKHRFVLLEILFLLANNPGAYYDKDDLAQMIWKGDYNPLIHDKLIYTSVSRIRKLLEPTAKESKRKYIVRGKDGYTFNPKCKIRFKLTRRSPVAGPIANVEITSPV